MAILGLVVFFAATIALGILWVYGAMVIIRRTGVLFIVALPLYIGIGAAASVILWAAFI